MHEASALLTIGFLLIVGIYIQVTILFGVYTPELFPTEVRLRANGICNTVGRAATIVSPFIVLALFRNYGVTGVLALMVGLLIIHIMSSRCGESSLRIAAWRTSKRLPLRAWISRSLTPGTFATGATGISPCSILIASASLLTLTQFAEAILRRVIGKSLSCGSGRLLVLRTAAASAVRSSVRVRQSSGAEHFQQRAEFLPLRNRGLGPARRDGIAHCAHQGRHYRLRRRATGSAPFSSLVTGRGSRSWFAPRTDGLADGGC
jgi:hypothetical protein